MVKDERVEQDELPSITFGYSASIFKNTCVGGCFFFSTSSAVVRASMAVLLSSSKGHT